MEPLLAAMRKLALAWWFPAAMLAGWESLSWLGWLNPLFFPAPSRIFVAAVRMIHTGEWVEQSLSTLHRMTAGAALGLVAGIACGLAMGASRPVRSTLEPLVSALNSTPKLAVMPLLLLVVGVGETARLAPIMLTGFVTLAMQTLDAVRSINPAYIETARNYGARRLALLRWVYLPAALPQLFTGLRLAAGRCLVITISVELLGSPDGLGRMIWLSWQTLATEKLYIGIFTTTMLGLAFHQGLAYLERRVAPWAATAEAS